MADGKRRFRVEDIFSHKALSAPTASPDGRRVVFVATQSDLKGNKVPGELWAWEEGRGAWQVTFGGKAARPLFSPRGDRLAFLSDRAGGEKQQVFVMAPRLCEGRKITQAEEGVVDFRWSPDGRRIAFLAVADKTPEEKKKADEKRDWWTVDADERKRRLFVTGAEGRGKPLQVSSDDEFVTSVAWAPDGKRLLYAACPRAITDSQLYETSLMVVGAGGRGRRKVCPLLRHEGRIEVSADGRAALLSESFGPLDQWHDTPKLVDLATGRRRPVARGFDLRGVAAQWLSEDEVLFEGDAGVGFRLYRCGVGGRPRVLDTGEGVSAFAAVARKAGNVFYVHSRAGEPDEIWMRSLDGSGQPRAITRINRPMSRVRLAAAEVVRWTSGRREVEGLLYLPTSPGPGRRGDPRRRGAGARKPYPLILMPHGGPYGASSDSYTGSVVPNLCCAAGYACFLPNFRGSTGYGRLFTRAIVRDWGDGPFADIMGGVDTLVRRGVVDGKRMAVFGGSYGGYMTCWTITHTRRFRCAVAVAAVTDIFSEWASTDIPTFTIYSSGGVWPSMTDRFWRDQSPIHHVDKVRTPTLIITGEVDTRVPPEQSHEFYRALRLRGVKTKLLLYPREPHGLAEPRHRVHYFKEILKWIDEHLRNLCNRGHR